MRVSRLVWSVGIVAAIVIGMVAFDAGLATAAIAAVVGAAVLKFGLVMIGGLAQPVPEPAEAGLLRKVKLVYRCSICGAEVKMTVAAAEDPEPPRHCMEDMELITPIE